MLQQSAQRVDRVVDDAACGPGTVGLGQCCVHLALRASVVEELGVDLGHDRSTGAHDQDVVTGELPDVCNGHANVLAARPQLVEIVGRNSDHHSLLSLRQPHFPRRQPRILAWHGVELDVGADALGHFADR